MLSVAAPLAISTTSLAQGAYGTVYSQTLQANGGQGGYTWSVNSALLPPGLFANAATGVISGTLTTAGSYAFVAQVTDASGNAAAQFLSIQINTPPEYCNQMTTSDLDLVRAEGLRNW